MLFLALILTNILSLGAEPLLLSCGGAGSANKTRSTSAFASNQYGEGAWIQGTTQTEVAFADQTDVAIDGDNSRIRLPHKLLPFVRGGNGGWFKLKNVKITDRAITGSASVNPINNPKVHIDRITGTISISGKAGDYFGRCERAANAQAF